nr:hypothetical protein F987_00518 [Acinetobacter gyllenbergii NIPH 230]
MSFVCSQLSQPNENGLQTCIMWQEQTDYLPALTAAEVKEISMYIILACVVAWCFRHLGEFIKTFMK